MAIGKLLSPMLLRRRPPRRGGSAYIHTPEKASAARSLSHLRRPPSGGGTLSQTIGSRPTPCRWKEASEPQDHFSRASQASVPRPAGSRRKTAASAGSSKLSSRSSLKGGLI